MAKPKKSDTQFQKDLREFNHVIDELSRYSALTISSNDANKVGGLLDKYSSLSDKLEQKTKNNRRQHEEVVQARGKLSDQDRSRIARQVNKHLKTSTSDENRKSIGSKNQVAAIFAQMEKLAEQIEQSSFLDNDLAEQFENLDKAIRRSSMPKLQQMNIQKLSDGVTAAVARLTMKERMVRSAIAKVVDEAANEVDRMTVGEALQALMGTDAPLAVMDQSGNEITMDSSRPLALLPAESLQDVVQTLAHNLQAAAGPDLSLSAPIMNALAEQFVGLQKGTKTHLSVVAEVGGQISAVHVNLRELVQNPKDVITELTLAFVKQGASTEQIAVKLTSQKETDALLLLTGAADEQSTDLQLAVANALATVASDEEGDPDSALSAEEITKVLAAVVVIAKTAKKLQTEGLKLEEEDDSLALGAGERQLSIQGNEFMDNKKQEYNELLSKLIAVIRDVDIKARKKSEKLYRPVSESISTLRDELRSAGEAFFKNPDAASFRSFVEDCEKAFTKVKPTLEQHRDLWHQIHPIVKGLLGILAALTVIPALVVEAKYGYQKTFFSTPKTATAEAVARFQADFDDFVQQQTPDAAPPAASAV